MADSFKNAALIGRVVTDEQTLSLEQLCQKCNIPSEKIIAYIQEGILKIEGKNPEEWRFSYLNVLLIHKAMRLEKDLKLNVAGTALALELMDQIETLQQRLNHYEC